MKLHFRRRAFGLVCVMSLVCLPRLTAQEVKSFDNDEFANQLQKSSFTINTTPAQSVAELWQFMARYQNALQNTKDEKKRVRAEFEYADITRAILQTGSDADYQKLTQIYKTLPADSWARRLMLQPLLNYWIKREIANLEKSGIRPHLNIQMAIAPTVTIREVNYLTPEARASLPETLNAVGPQVQQGWKQYKGCIVALAEALKTQPEVEPISVQPNWKLVCDAADDFFDGKTQNIVPRLANLQWGSWCGTGSEMFYDPKYRLLFASLLKERRYEAAIGALFPLITQGRGMMSSLQSEDDWKQRFLRWCGVDWEPLFAGAALEYQKTLDELARYGSPQAARLLMQMGAVPNMSERGNYLNAVAAFISKSNVATGYDKYPASGIVRQNKEPIPDALQQQLLQIVSDQIRPGAKPYTLETATHILANKARLESKEALHRLLALPYSELRESAALTLRAMGEEVKVEPVKPVAFRILRNGQANPYGYAKWEIRGDTGAISSAQNADDKGLLNLKRNIFMETPEDSRFTFASSELVDNESLWFEVQRDKPTDLDAITDIPIEIGALTLQLETPQPAAFYAGKNAILHVSAERPQGESKYFTSISGYKRFAVPFQKEIRFWQLQKRDYEIELLLPGAALWQGKVKLDEDKKTVRVALQKGADLKVEITAPGAELRDKAPRQTLLLDGKDMSYYFDSQAKIYRGLPMGNYTLKIASSAEKEKSYGTRPAGVPAGRFTSQFNSPTNPPAYEGTERKFVIDENSPAVIDLGNIELQPAL